jgi:iron complex transport system ATP-binding protein
MDDPIIRIEHATVRRNGIAILNDATLSVHNGEHLAIIGPNGAGKSTLVQVISQEVHPIREERMHRILFGCERWEILELRKKLGIVSQSLQYLCNSTYKGLEIVLSGFFSSIGLDFHHQVTTEMVTKALEVMQRYGTTHLKEKQMNRMSSGEARRILLSRALVTEPQVMLLDEAGTALDFPGRLTYRSTLKQLDREGKTIILATHELSEIIPSIKRIVVMQEGKIVADGPKEEVLNEELLSDVYGNRVYLDERDGLYSAWC